MTTTADRWHAYVAWLRDHVPAAHANLAPGATDAQLAALEERIGVALPEAVKTVWRINDGQRVTMLSSQIVKATPTIPTLSFLSTELVGRVWGEWDELRRGMTAEQRDDLDAGTSSAIPGVTRAHYSNPAWIPLWADPTRPDYVGLDLDPGEAGVAGQIINFGRNEDRHFQFATDVDHLLDLLLEEVRTGDWTATEMGFGDETIPWFGEPRRHFFMALHGHWQDRHPRKPRPRP